MYSITHVSSFIQVGCRAFYPKSKCISRHFSSSCHKRWVSSAVASTDPDTFYSTEQLQEEQVIEDQRPFFPIYYNDVYEVRLPPKHRFPMEKYRKVREMVQKEIQTMDSNNKIDCEFRISPLATVEELTLTHSPDYVHRFITGNITQDEQRNVGFPWSTEGVNRALSSTGGTVAAAVSACTEWEKRLMTVTRDGNEDDNQKRDNSNNNNAVIQPCWGAHVAGGTHHAFYDYGEGFCVFSDIAVAANVILQRFPNRIKRILIIDLDVHQGNGNAVLFRNNTNVFTFSLHCNANYFSKKQKSDSDIELPPGCNDETYLSTLRHWLKQIKLHAGKFDLIFYQAGVDILEYDRLGRMSITSNGIKRRNQMIFDFATYEMQNIPLVITMGGGYPRYNDNWTPILNAHSDVYLQAYDFLSNVPVSK